MKINLLTFCSVPNYGGMLQCYALYRYLEKAGHQVTVLDVPISNHRRLAYLPKRYWTYRFAYDFRKKYIPRITTDLSIAADLYMIGSDQVWNPRITRETFDRYFFSFAPDTAKLVSFAASFGTSELDWGKEQLALANKLLHRFSTITVREWAGVEICRKIFGLEAKQVVDPTLLLSDFSDIAGPLSDNENILTFKLYKNPEWQNFLPRLKKRFGRRLKELTPHHLPGLGDVRDLNVFFPPVEQWIREIGSTGFFLTDSFHGTIFALLYKRNFAVVPGVPGRVGRLLELLAQLGLEDRCFQRYEDFYRSDCISSPINYEKINSRLEKMISRSRQVILNILTES